MKNRKKKKCWTPDTSHKFIILYRTVKTVVRCIIKYVL